MKERLAAKNITPQVPPPEHRPAPKPTTAIPLHPLLAEGASSNSSGSSGWKNRGKNSRIMAPKFTSVAANARLAAASPSNHSSKAASPVPPPNYLAPSASDAATSSNPYLASSTTAADPTDPNADPDPEAHLADLRRRRLRGQLRFSAKGKYIQRAEEMRKQAKLEQLKQRIAEQTKKAGLDSEFDVLGRDIKRQPPPEVEWWDFPLLKNGSYDDLDLGPQEGTLQDQVVTLFIEHPVPIPGPDEGKPQPVRGLMLTKKEQKKMRRQRRAAELSDKQDRQRLGLLPMDPPKVKVANMMKVLTASAVQDPTKVEARVKAEAAARERKHEQMNAERALTDEQRREKVEAKKVKQEDQGVFGCAFKIKYLVNGAHKFKLRAVAEQLGLTGLLIFHPDFALVYVEGSAHALKKYKRLLLVRIDWTEQSRPLAGGDDGEAGDEPESSRPTWQPVQPVPETLDDNKCEIVWEGQVSSKSFRSFRYRNVEGDREGKDVLGKGREGVWDLTKRWVWEGVD